MTDVQIYFLGYFFGILTVLIILLIKSKIGSPTTESDFDIEFMPISNRYYPRVGKHYIYRNYPSGFLSLRADINYSEYSSSEKGAVDTYKMYLEHTNKSTIIIKPTL